MPVSWCRYLFHLFVELGEHEPAVLLGHGALVLLHSAPAERALELLTMYRVSQCTVLHLAV